MSHRAMNDGEHAHSHEQRHGELPHEHSHSDVTHSHLHPHEQGLEHDRAHGH